MLTSRTIGFLLFLMSLGLFMFLNHDRQAYTSYFPYLADAFIHGRLGLLEAPSWLNELVPGSNGQLYVAYPPAPSILLVPFVAIFGPELRQEHVSVALGALNVVLVFHMLLATRISTRGAVLLALTFAFGSVTWYASSIGTAWHFAHVVSLFAMLCAIRLCQRDASLWLIGFFFSFAGLSRLPMLAAAPFFVAYIAARSSREGFPTQFTELVQSAYKVRRKHLGSFIANGARFSGPLLMGFSIFGLYNAARFGSALEPGYALIPGLLQEDQYRDGFFSISNVVKKIHAMFLTSFTYDREFPWLKPRLLGGLSIFLTTPLVLWAIKARQFNLFVVGTWMAIGLICAPILFHADAGGSQWGFRYAQDFYPFIFLLIAHGTRGYFSFEAKCALVIGFVVNLLGMWAYYFDWWA
jgi:hypothetical protein